MWSSGRVQPAFRDQPSMEYYAFVKVTLTLEDLLVEEAREMATRRGASLDQMIQELLEDALATRDRESRLEELERLWERSTGDSKGRKWRREALYDRPSFSLGRKRR